MKLVSQITKCVCVCCNWPVLQLEPLNFNQYWSLVMQIAKFQLDYKVVFALKGRKVWPVKRRLATTIAAAIDKSCGPHGPC